MPPTLQKTELTELTDRVQSHLTQTTGGPAQVKSLRPLYGGACQDNFLLDVVLPGEDTPRRLVLRSDAVSGISFTLSRREEFAVIRLARSAGVLTPSVHYLSSDLVRPNAHAYFMDFVLGEAIGRRIVSAKEYTQARQVLPEQLAKELAKIHSVGIDRASEAEGVRVPKVSVLESELACVDQMMAKMKEPHPALEIGRVWLRDQHNQPPSINQEVTLVHGDFRTGNYLTTQDGLAAILDWEFAHFGSPMEDLAWFCLRDWRFGQLRQQAGGIASREVFYNAYEKHSGRKVDRAAVHYFEVLGNIRWALGCIDQGERYLSHGEGDLELVAIGRRCAEMEYEALQLIKQHREGRHA